MEGDTQTLADTGAAKADPSRHWGSEGTKSMSMAI